RRIHERLFCVGRSGAPRDVVPAGVRVDLAGKDRGRDRRACEGLDDLQLLQARTGAHPVHHRDQPAARRQVPAGRAHPDRGRGTHVPGSARRRRAVRLELLRRDGAQAEEPRIHGPAPPAMSPADGPPLVTGAAGFIGSHLVDALIAGGEPPIALDTPAAWARLRNLDGLTPRCDRIELDAAADVRPILAERRPRAIFHLSAFASVTASVREPVKDYERNARATLYLLEAVRAAS